MYNVRTGERLWSTSYQVSESNVDITRDRLRMKSTQVFESALQRIVNKAMETLPDGAGCLKKIEHGGFTGKHQIEKALKSSRIGNEVMG